MGDLLAGFPTLHSGNRDGVAAIFWLYLTLAVVGVLAYAAIGVTSG